MAASRVVAWFTPDDCVVLEHEHPPHFTRPGRIAL